MTLACLYLAFSLHFMSLNLVLSCLPLCFQLSRLQQRENKLIGVASASFISIITKGEPMIVIWMGRGNEHVHVEYGASIPMADRRSM